MTDMNQIEGVVELADIVDEEDEETTAVAELDLDETSISRTLNNMIEEYFIKKAAINLGSFLYDTHTPSGDPGINKTSINIETEALIFSPFTKCYIDYQIANSTIVPHAVGMMLTPTHVSFIMSGDIWQTQSQDLESIENCPSLITLDPIEYRGCIIRIKYCMPPVLAEVPIMLFGRVCSSEYNPQNIRMHILNTLGILFDQLKIIRGEVVGYCPLANTQNYYDLLSAYEINRSALEIESTRGIDYHKHTGTQLQSVLVFYAKISTA